MSSSPFSPDSAAYPIAIPAGFAPAFALGYADSDGTFAPVAQATPLPVHIMNTELSGTPPAPLEGLAPGVVLAGPFTPMTDRPVHLALWGTWTGTVQLERAATIASPRLPTTAAGALWGHFTANACEQVWSECEAGAALYLAIAVATGTLHYQVAQ